jgi:HSP20 family protein
MALAPFRGFWDVQSELDRMFDEMLGGMFGNRQRALEGAGTTLWAPRLETLARGGDLVIRADLPGVSLGDVDITLDGNVLTISGQRKAAATEDGANYYLKEVRYGAFRRSMTVPENVDPDSIKATFQDGVLEVVLPNAVAQSQPKHITIEAGDQKSIES